jgi:hypothetical protein
MSRERLRKRVTIVLLVLGLIAAVIVLYSASIVAIGM